MKTLALAFIILASHMTFAHDGNWGKIGEEVKAKVEATKNCLAAKEYADKVEGPGYRYAYKISAYNATISKCYSEMQISKSEKTELDRRWRAECGPSDDILGWLGVAMTRECEMNLVVEAWKRHHP